MSPRDLAVSLVALLVLVSLCSSAAHAQPATATAPGSAPTTAPEPMVANPHYLAWASFKPGTQVDLDMNISAGGQQMTSHVTMTLNEITPQRAVIESVAKVSLRGVPAQEHKQSHTFNAKVPQSEAQRAYLPPGGTGETRDAGTETIEVAGKTYATSVQEFQGKVQGQDATAKMWRSEEVPGGLVKMQTASGNTKVEMLLTKVTEK